jgi:hypothetical protein
MMIGSLSRASAAIQVHGRVGKETFPPVFLIKGWDEYMYIANGADKEKNGKSEEGREKNQTLFIPFLISVISVCVYLTANLVTQF